MLNATAKLRVLIDSNYRELRVERGMDEPDALAALEHDAGLWKPGSGAPAESPGRRTLILEVLRESGLLDDWPIGWTEEEAAKLAQRMSFRDVVAAFSRIVDAPREQLLVAVLLQAQGHLAPVLRAIGPAVHVMPENAQFSAGKSRCAEALTFLAGGEWFESATVPFLKAARREGACVLGVDEGDEAEKDSPGVKAFLLASHNWNARYGKFSDPDEKGKRAPETVPYGGPVNMTFRKKPWPAVASRALIVETVRTKDPRFSDDGAGEGMRRILAPSAAWLKQRCDAVLREWDEKRALVRVHEPTFRAKLDRVSKDLPILRQRDKARVYLFIAEVLGVDLEREVQAVLEGEEDESENATVIEAIESDPLYLAARESSSPCVVEDLRLSVQKRLRESRESVDLTRNRFAGVLAEMDFSKKVGPTWKRMEIGGREVTVILPALLKKPATKPTKGFAEFAESADSPYGETANPADSADPVPSPMPTPSEALARFLDLARGNGGTLHVERLSPEDRQLFDRYVRRWKQEGELWEQPTGSGIYHFLGGRA